MLPADLFTVITPSATVHFAGDLSFVETHSSRFLPSNRMIASEGAGLRSDDLIRAIREEFKEHEDLPNTTNPDDWAKISGKTGERIVVIRTLISSKQGTQPGRSIDTVSNTGQYL